MISIGNVSLHKCMYVCLNFYLQPVNTKISLLFLCLLFFFILCAFVPSSLLHLICFPPATNIILPTGILFHDICIWPFRQLCLSGSHGLWREIMIRIHTGKSHFTLLIDKSHQQLSAIRMNIKGCETACAWQFFSLKDAALFLFSPDVFLMSPTGCYYRL